MKCEIKVGLATKIMSLLQPWESLCVVYAVLLTPPSFLVIFLTVVDLQLCPTNE